MWIIDNMITETNDPTCEACEGPLSDCSEEAQGMTPLCNDCIIDINMQLDEAIRYEEGYPDFFNDGPSFDSFAQYDDDPNPYHGTYSEE